MREHETQFEELIALASIGEVSDAERTALEDHLGACKPCRERLREFSQIDYQLYQWSALTAGKPAQLRDMQTRFESRLLATGALLSRASSHSRKSVLRAIALAAVVAVTFCLCLKDPSRFRSEAPDSRVEITQAAVTPLQGPNLAQRISESAALPAGISVRKHVRKHSSANKPAGFQQVSSAETIHFVYRGIGYGNYLPAFSRTVAMNSGAFVGQDMEPFPMASKTVDFSQMHWALPAHRVFPYRTDLVASSFNNEHVSFDVSNFYLSRNGTTDLTRAR